MTEQYVLTTTLIEDQASSEAHGIFLRFRSELLQRACTAQYPRIVEAEAFYDTSDKIVEVEVRLTVTPPLSEAISQASELLREGAHAAGIRIIAADGDGVADHMNYADQGSHLVASP